MEIENFIQKQFKEHYTFIESIKPVEAAFCTAFRHPKTGRRITWSEKCTLIDRDAEKRTAKILNELKK